METCTKRTIYEEYNIGDLTIKNVPHIEYEKTWGKYYGMSGRVFNNLLKIIIDNENSEKVLKVLEYKEK